VAVNYIFILVTFWDVRPCNSVDNYDTVADEFKTKSEKYNMRYVDERKCPELLAKQWQRTSLKSVVLLTGRYEIKEKGKRERSST
jgi:hypothetical protein